MIESYDSAFFHANRMLDLKENMVNYAGIIEIEVGFAFWKKGHVEEGRRMINAYLDYLMQLIDLERDINDHSLYTLACIYTIFGHYDKAMQYIQRLDTNFPKYRYLIVSLEDDAYLKDIRDRKHLSY